MEALELLKKYVSLPSGSLDVADVTVMAESVGADLAELGFNVELHRDGGLGPVVEGTFGSGPEKIMIIGHMDTVFPRADYEPFRVEGNYIYGSGAMDMKGGLVVMNKALAATLPEIDGSKYTIKVIINPDEELGSPTSHDIIYNTAVGAKACLSFEPARKGGGLVCERKGVTSFTLKCGGVRGHAGSAYLKCHSAIQELCRRIDEIYTLRDDSRDISINVGIIKGGTAENVVADYAEAHCEYRYFDMAYRAEIMDKLKEICARPGIDGCTTELTFGATHPSSKMTPGSQKLLDAAMGYAREMGVELFSERTGGAGDISIAATAGAPVLDGLGLEGVGAHTKGEYAYLDKFPFYIELASKMIRFVTE